MGDRADKRELRERFDQLEVSPHAEMRMQAAIDGALHPRRGVRRRSLLVVAAALLLLAAAATAIAVWISRDVSVPASDTGRAGIAESPVLARAPWLLTDQRGAPTIVESAPLPSVRFAPGTTYRQATRELFVSVVERGEIPRSGRLASPTRLGVVWSVERAGPRLDLRAPFGYDARSGAVRSPSYSLAGSLDPDAVDRITGAIERGTPAGEISIAALVVDTPRLARCQRQTLDGPGAPCPAVRGGR